LRRSPSTEMGSDGAETIPNSREFCEASGASGACPFPRCEARVVEERALAKRSGTRPPLATSVPEKTPASPTPDKIAGDYAAAQHARRQSLALKTERADRLGFGPRGLADASPLSIGC
jgi:hypothetical protein